MTDIITRRAAQRGKLLDIYALIQKLIDSDAGERADTLAELERDLGVKALKSRNYVQFRLATDWLSLDLDEGLRSFHYERLDRWRDEISCEIAKDPFEADSHVTHLHLLDLHGDELSVLLGSKFPEHAPLRLFDRLHCDVLTLSSLVHAANRSNRVPYCAPSAAAETCIETAELFLCNIAHISAVEGLVVNGDTIHINGSFGGTSVTDRWFTFKSEIPDTLFASLAGQGLHRAIEIDGLLPSDLRIVKASRSNNGSEIILETNRFEAPNMFVLNPARQISQQLAA